MQRKTQRRLLRHAPRSSDITSFRSCACYACVIECPLVAKDFFWNFPSRLWRLYGRNAGYPAPPVQTRTCSFPASGSSVVLASAVQSPAFRHTLSETGVACQLWLCWLSPAGRLASVAPVRPCPAEVACAGCVLPSRPSPCSGLSPPPSTMRDKIPPPHVVGFPCDSTPPPPCRPGTQGASQVLRRLSSCMPRPEDSGGPAPPRPYGGARVAFGSVQTLGVRNKPCRSYTSTSGCAVTPAVYRILCLRFAPLVRQAYCPGSAMDARLDTGGWLALTRQGLSPCKRRQAFLAR
jgi:hypothetical protein